jgi:hypothetical protein
MSSKARTYNTTTSADYFSVIDGLIGLVERNKVENCAVFDGVKIDQAMSGQSCGSSLLAGQ